MASVKEREEQCKYLLEEVSQKTAELVLSQEHVFAKRAEEMLHAVYNECSAFRQAFTGQTITIPSGKSFDDAKKGEDKEDGEGVKGERSVGEGRGEMDDAWMELARKKGKEVVVWEEKRKPLNGKVLASSLAAQAVSTAHTEKQISKDEALALALQQEFDLKNKGITKIPLAKPLQAVSSQAGASSSSIQAPASTLALATPTVAATSASQAIIPSAPTEKKMPPPPPPLAPKTLLKRSAPESRELDPAAKRQKIQQIVIAKSSRLERRKKGEEERKRKAEKEEKIRTARIKKVEERIETHWNEVRLIQSAHSRSAFIPFTPNESEACQTQGWIDTCRFTIKEMTDSGRYTPDECDFIRKRVNEKTPLFNSAAGVKFNRIMKELASRSEEEMNVRRTNHPDACEIEKFISDDLLEMWSICKEKFIKAYYFWQVVPFQDECSKLDALNNFMCMYNEELRRKIFTQVELSDPKPKIVIVPAMTEFPMPLLPNSSVPNRRIIDEEVDEALQIESSHRANKYNVKTMEEKVLSAYYMDEEDKPAEDL